MIGNKIFLRLEELDKNNLWLSEKLGVSPQYISSIKFKKSFTTDTLEKISVALGVPMKYWFEDEALSVAEDRKSDYTSELVLQEKLLIAREELFKSQDEVSRLKAELERCQEEVRTLKHKKISESGITENAGIKML